MKFLPTIFNKNLTYVLKATLGIDLSLLHLVLRHHFGVVSYQSSFYLEASTLSFGWNFLNLFVFCIDWLQLLLIGHVVPRKRNLCVRKCALNLVYYSLTAVDILKFWNIVVVIIIKMTRCIRNIQRLFYLVVYLLDSFNDISFYVTILVLYQ